MQLATRSGARGRECAAHRTHVGYYLIDAGRARTGARGARCARRWRIACAARVARRPLAWFAGAIVCATLLLAMLPLAIASNGFERAVDRAARSARGGRALAVLVLLMSASQLAVAIVNWLVPLLVPPRSLPRMDYFVRHPERIAHAGGRADDAVERGRPSTSWSRRSRCAFSPTATRTCTSRC